MKRFLSWVVMLLATVLAWCIIYVVIIVVKWAFFAVMELSVGWRIFWYVMGGSAALGALGFPLFMGPALIIKASNAVAMSAKGARYLVWSILMLVFFVLDFVLGLGLDKLLLTDLYLAVFALILLVLSRNKDLAAF